MVWRWEPPAAWGPRRSQRLLQMFLGVPALAPLSLRTQGVPAVAYLHPNIKEMNLAFSCPSTFNCHPPFLLPHLGQLFQRIIFPLQFSSLSHFSMHLGVKKQISSQVTILAIVLMSHNSKGKKTCTLCNQLLKILKVAYNPFQIVCGSFHVSF